MMKIWKCTECKGADGCLALDLDETNDNEIRCLFEVDNPAWKQATDYEVVEILRPGIKIGCTSEEFKNGIERSFNQGSPTQQQTPNCAICRWCDMSNDTTIMSDCAAQGFRRCDEVYNNEQCQQLFESAGTNVKNLNLREDEKAVLKPGVTFI